MLKPYPIHVIPKPFPSQVVAKNNNPRASRLAGWQRQYHREAQRAQSQCIAPVRPLLSAHLGLQEEPLSGPGLHVGQTQEEGSAHDSQVCSDTTLIQVTHLVVVVVVVGGGGGGGGR